MTVGKYVGGIFRGTAAERGSYTTTNLNAGWIWIETDTNPPLIYFWTGSAWRLITEKDVTETLTNKTISGASNTLSNIADSSLSAKVILTDAAQTFITNAKTFNDQMIKLRNPADSFSYTLIHGAIGANRNITLPVLTGNDIFTFNDATQTLTGKTLTSPTINGATIATSTIDAQLNTFKNIHMFPSEGKTGSWMGTSQTNGSTGLWQGAFSAIAVGTGANGGVGRDSTGNFNQWTSGANVNGIAGVMAVILVTERDYNPVTEWVIKLGQTTNTRMFFGWRASVTAPTSTADPLASGVAGVLFGLDTGVDANWHIYQNDTSGGSDSTTIANVAAADTSAHTFAIRAVEASSKFQYAYNFTDQSTATWNDINTTIPPATTGIAPCWFLEGLTAGAKTFNCYYVQHYQEK